MKKIRSVENCKRTEPKLRKFSRLIPTSRTILDSNSEGDYTV